MATHTVTTTDDVVDENDGVLSLREAVALANADSLPDNITFAAGVSGGTIVLSSELAITDDLTIDGDIDGDNEADITISGNDASRIVNITGATTDVALKSLTLTNGYSADHGGAVRAWDIGKLTILDTTIQNSKSDSYGGAIRAYGAEVEIVNSLLHHNFSGEEGGGLFMSDSDTTIVNSTFYYNDATNGGGGISTWTSNLDIYNSTIYNNWSALDGGGGGIRDLGSTITVANSVIALNISGPDFSTPDDVEGTLFSAINSAFSTSPNITTSQSNLLNIGDPGLDPNLADNGGTVQTLGILPGSVLIDAGSNAAIPQDFLDLDGDLSSIDPLPYDARGHDRINNGTVDIGAAEFRQGIDYDLHAGLLALSLADQNGNAVAANDLFDGNNETIVFVLEHAGYGDNVPPQTQATIAQANALLAAAETSGHDLDIRIVCLDGYDGPLEGLSEGVSLFHLVDHDSEEAQAAAYDLRVAYALVSGLDASTMPFKALHRLPGTTDIDIVASTEQTVHIGAGFYQQKVLATPLEAALAGTGAAIDLTEFVTPVAGDFTAVGAFNEVGEVVPELTFTDADGEAFSLRGEGKGLMVLTFCAQWCGPCQFAATELPEVMTNVGDGFTFVEIILENANSGITTTANANQWRVKYDLTDPVVTPNGDAQTAVDLIRGVDLKGYPTYLIIDQKTGEIVSRFFGQPGEQGFTEALLDVSDDYYGALARKKFEGTSKKDTFEGGLGFDTISGASGNDTLSGGNGNDRIAGGDGNDTLLGETGSDTLSGGAGSDTITGAEANDVIDGGNGVDDLDGGTGNDTVAGGAGADVLAGGEGRDTLSYAASNAAVVIDLSASAVQGGHATGDVILSFENAIGSRFADILTGDDVSNTFEGGIGGDTLAGGLGSDTLSYASSLKGVTINLKSGVAGGGDAKGDQFTDFENVIGSRFDDVITGDDGDNDLDGGAGNDILIGGDGFNRLIGGKGIDKLTGGADLDRFYLSPDKADRDVISDFSDDILVIEARLFGPGFGADDKAAVWGGELDAALFVANTTGLAESAEDRLIYNTETGKLFLDVNGSANGGSRLIATFIGTPPELTAASFDLQ
ncbi:choice-of-anchor Q domain-containing protein [Rhizobium sp. LjRoot254]|uniref:choice-of-anchor Q domain-containing protein n=1 Tax=Rhizobium sp. LjRoot254 TaxID=3342297 RepID=UPI003ECEF9BA